MRETVGIEGRRQLYSCGEGWSILRWTKKSWVVIGREKTVYSGKPIPAYFETNLQGSVMILTKSYRRLLKLIFLCALLPAAVSCSLFEKRIAHTAGDPTMPADTHLEMRLEPGEQPGEISERTLHPGPLKIT
ncbi:MAG: hypothetical protein P8Y00_03020, partial [Deltaproteobacteria bacterium]